MRAAEAAAAAARAHAAGEAGTLRLGFSPGAHYVAQAALAQLARERPALRVHARQDNTGVLVGLVAAGELEIALGFCAQAADGVRRDVVREERAVLAVGEQHPLAGRDAVALADLAEETFALVDAHDGSGYNAAVRAHCRAAGFEARTPPTRTARWPGRRRSAPAAASGSPRTRPRPRPPAAYGCCAWSRRSASRST